MFEKQSPRRVSADQPRRSGGARTGEMTRRAARIFASPCHPSSLLPKTPYTFRQTGKRIAETNMCAHTKTRGVKWDTGSTPSTARSGYRIGSHLQPREPVWTRRTSSTSPPGSQLPRQPGSSSEESTSPCDPVVRPTSQRPSTERDRPQTSQDAIPPCLGRGAFPATSENADGTRRVLRRLPEELVEQEASGRSCNDECDPDCRGRLGDERRRVSGRGYWTRRDVTESDERGSGDFTPQRECGWAGPSCA